MDETSVIPTILSALFKLVFQKLTARKIGFYLLRSLGCSSAWPKLNKEEVV